MGLKEFSINEELLEQFRIEAEQQHPEETSTQVYNRAVYRCLSLNKTSKTVGMSGSAGSEATASQLLQLQAEAIEKQAHQHEQTLGVVSSLNPSLEVLRAELKEKMLEVTKLIDTQNIEYKTQVVQSSALVDRAFATLRSELIEQFSLKFKYLLWGLLLLALLVLFSPLLHAQAVNPCIATSTTPSFVQGTRAPCRLTLDGATVVTTGGTALVVSGTVAATQSGTWNIGTVTTVTGATISNGAGASAVNIQDGGNTITVDGTVTATPTGTQDVNLVSTITVPVSAASLPLPSGAATEATLSTLNGKVTAVNTGAVTVSTFPDNEPFNIAQVNGATVTTGVGTAAASLRVANFQHDGTSSMRVDQCSDIASTYGRTAISTNATGTVLVSGTASNYTFICGYTLVADAAVDVSLTSGTGSTCGTGTTALLGSTTAANGLALAANGGITNASTGTRHNWTEATGDDLCLLLSSAVRVTGTILWAKSTRSP